jgi:formylmethanofuran dehydrogenase subunit E
MKKELDKALVKKYPRLYRDRYGSRKDTCMSRGFECGDGWFGIIDELSAKLEAEIARLQADGMSEAYLPRAFQVKEKLGRLELYLRWGRETIFNGHEVFRSAIDEARKKSFVTCEDCGATGRLRDDRSYILTLCDECDTKTSMPT